MWGSEIKMAKDKKSKPKHKYTIPEILVGLVLFTALFAGLIGAVTGSSETSKSDIAIGEKNDPYRMEVTPAPEEDTSVELKTVPEVDTSVNETVGQRNPCKLPVADGRGDVSIGGWPRINQRMRATGTVTSQVIMVDFPDAPAKITPKQAFENIKGVTETFSEMSYGKFNYLMEPTYKWYRMSKPATEYDPLGPTFKKHRAYLSEALQLADPDVDFSKSESFIVLTDPGNVPFVAGPAFTAISSKEAITLDNTDFYNGTGSAADLAWFGFMWANHELSNTLALVDLYAFESEDTKNNFDQFRFTGNFSYMGDLSPESLAPGLFAFERWNLGWLEDDQIICSTANTITQLITPVAESGGIKAVIVPITSTKVVVVESRRPLGIDRNLKKSGALVYVVDSTVESGLGPIQVYPIDTKNDPQFTQAPRAAGESVEIEGLNIKIITSTDAGDTVFISKK